MAGQSCLRWELPALCVSGGFGSTPLVHAERIEIAGESVEYPATAATRDRLAFSRATWDSHLYRFDAGRPVEAVAPSSSFETDPHFSPDGRRHCVWSQGAPATFRSGWRRPTGRTPASSPTTRANGQARLHGRRMDARSRSTAAALAHRFASGSSTPMAAPRDRSQAGPATTRCQGGPRDGKWIYFAHELGATRDIWRVPSTGRATATGDADGQRLRRL